MNPQMPLRNTVDTSAMRWKRIVFGSKFTASLGMHTAGWMHTKRWSAKLLHGVKPGSCFNTPLLLGRYEGSLREFSGL
jgi:hypothetical protein